MHKAIAVLETAIQNKMNVIIHQTESQYDNIVASKDYENTVHAINEILFVVENHIDIIAVCAEMPAIADRNSLAFNNLPIEAKVSFNLTH